MAPELLTIAKLSEETGYAERTIRNYIHEGVIPAVDETVGPGGYGPLHVRSLLAITRLNREGVRRHDDLRVRLQAMSSRELARFAGEEEEPQAGPHETPPAPPAAVVREAPAVQSRESWERIVLAPGLELHVRSDAGPEVWRLAVEIVARRQP